MRVPPISNELERFERLVQKIEPGSTLLRTWALTGGVSAHVTALEIERSDGQTIRRIVRRHGEVDLNRNPHVARDEFHLLQILQSAGVAAPVPYYLDQSGEIFSTPYVVLECVEGQSELAPSDLNDFTLQFATHLAGIHNLAGSNPDLSFLPKQAEKYASEFRESPTAVDASLDEGRIRATLEAAWPLPQQNRSVLLHGDYWPGNTIWWNSRLVAVVDWEDAGVGDPLEDVANTRLELLWAFGLDAMQHFTRIYFSITDLDFANLPYWDLCAALRPASKIAEWAGDEATEAAKRAGHRLFVTQAFEQTST
jgi:aminoglycoside phosphotransferase (APT) family kinase protein